MVCVKCSAAADLEEAAHSLDLLDLVDTASINDLHGECKGGTWCDCQHKRQYRPTTLITTASGRAMCTCHGPELPHRPHLCDVVASRIERHAATTTR